MDDLAVLIVNWNVRELLKACLESVYEDLAYNDLKSHVWVVDNASQDDSAAMVGACFPQTRLLVSPKNLGFAGGNNLALQNMAESSPPRYVLLLNADTQLRPGALKALTNHMEQDPRAGVVGAQLLYGDGGFQHSAFRFPGLWQILFDLFQLPARLYDTRLNRRYPRKWYQRGVPFAVDHPLGAAMMLRWDVVDQVGVLDDGFFMYCEEIDWCMRIKEAGWRIFCVPKAKVIHYEGQSTRQIREESFVNLWHSRRRLYDKHYGPLKHFCARHLVQTGMRNKARNTRKEASCGSLDPSEATARIRAFARVTQCFD